MSKPTLSEWYAQQYLGAVGLDSAEGGRQFKRLVDTFPAVDANGFVQFSGRGRMRMFMELRMTYPVGRGGYSCLAVTATLAGHTTHVAYVYWRRATASGRATGGGHATGGGPQNDDAGEPEYICVSPTFNSRDGEYRNKFLRWPDFVKLCDECRDELSVYERAVIDGAEDGSIMFGLTAYPVADFDAAAAASDRLRIPIMALAVMTVAGQFRLSRGLLMQHTDQSYVDVITALPPIPVPREWSQQRHQLRDLATFAQSETETVWCGQKLVPLYLRELMSPDDPTLGSWRELMVTQDAGDLVLNFVAPTFALYNQWTFVEGADAALFGGGAMRARYARGRVADDAVQAIRDARRTLGTAETTFAGEELQGRLHDDLEYAHSFLQVSDVALLHTVEDVGWTLESHARFASRIDDSVSATTAAGAFAAADDVARLLFEYAYAAHCLHTRVGAAHTDLHANNLTYMVRHFRAVQPVYDDPFVLYVAGGRGEADAYLFPATGTNGCLIDYSRAILGPAYAGRLGAGRSPQFAPNFYRDQVNRVMRALHRYAPEYVAKHATVLKAAVLADFDRVFPVLCAVDFIAIGASAAAVFAAAEAGGAAPDEYRRRDAAVAPEAHRLAAALERAGREAFITGLHGIAEVRGAGPPAPFPGDAVLAAVFAPWSFAGWGRRDPARLRAAQLADAYNYANPVRYSGRDYATFPPWARIDVVTPHLGEYTFEGLFATSFEPFFSAIAPHPRAAVVAEAARAAVEKLDGPPVSAASSWID